MKIEDVLKIIKPALNSRWEWCACDFDGRWFLYEGKPEIDIAFANNMWLGAYVRHFDLSELFDIDRPKNWKKSLIKIEDVK